MIRFLLALALLASGCAPAGCDGAALAFRAPTGPNHYVAPADLAGGGGGAPAIGNFLTDRTAPQSGSTYTVSLAGLGSNLTAGSTLVVLGRTAGYVGATITGVSDSTNGAWTLAKSETGDATNGLLYFYYVKNNASTSKPTLTITFGQLYVNYDLIFAEAKNVSTSAPLDATNSSLNASGTAYHGSITTTGATDIVLTGTTSAYGDTLDTPQAGFTIQQFPVGGTPQGLGYNASFSTGTINPGHVMNQTWAGSVGVVIALKP